MDHRPKGPLTYFFSEKEKVLVVSLVGPLVRDEKEVVDRLVAEVGARTEAAWVVLNFHDVPLADKSVVGCLARLLRDIRARPALLRLCFLNHSVHHFLMAEGLLRNEELALDLTQALISLKHEDESGQRKRVAAVEMAKPAIPESSTGKKAA